jgi:hypothetical protein
MIGRFIQGHQGRAASTETSTSGVLFNDEAIISSAASTFSLVDEVGLSFSVHLFRWNLDSSADESDAGPNTLAPSIDPASRSMSVCFPSAEPVGLKLCHTHFDR